MAAGKRPALMVRVTNGGEEGYSAVALLHGAYRGGERTLIANACDVFENQTGIALRVGQSKVFRMVLVAQRKKARAKK